MEGFGGNPGGKLKNVIHTEFRCYSASDPNGPDGLGSGSGTVRFEHDGEKLIGKCSWRSSHDSLRGEFPGVVEEGIRLALEQHLNRSNG